MRLTSFDRLTSAKIFAKHFTWALRTVVLWCKTSYHNQSTDKNFNPMGNLQTYCQVFPFWWKRSQLRRTASSWSRLEGTVWAPSSSSPLRGSHQLHRPEVGPEVLIIIISNDLEFRLKRPNKIHYLSCLNFCWVFWEFLRERKFPNNTCVLPRRKAFEGGNLFLFYS